MPSHWCQCNECKTSFLATPGNSIRCPVCQSVNVMILSTIPDPPKEKKDDR